MNPTENVHQLGGIQPREKKKKNHPLIRNPKFLSIYLIFLLLLNSSLLVSRTTTHTHNIPTIEQWFKKYYGVLGLRKIRQAAIIREFFLLFMSKLPSISTLTYTSKL
jgi:hypothetical protein